MADVTPAPTRQPALSFDSDRSDFMVSEAQVIDLNPLEDIERELEEKGYTREVQDLRRAYEGGATGNEILGAVRFHLRQIDRANLSISPKAMKAMRKIIEQVDARFSG